MWGTPPEDEAPVSLVLFAMNHRPCFAVQCVRQMHLESEASCALLPVMSSRVRDIVRQAARGRPDTEGNAYMELR